MLAALILPQVQRDQLAQEARAAFPRECCGLIEGVTEGEEARAVALHPTRNLADAPERFEIDPAEHIRLLRDMRGTKRRIIGCYHSHPNGAAEPSLRDREAAAEDGFLWLIQPVTGEGAGKAVAFVFEKAGFRPLSLAPKAPEAL
jgi:proteasome lid subunit RPN8/RPN11